MGEPLKTGEVNYTVLVSPNPLLVEAALSFSGTKLSASLTAVPNLSVTLKPQYSWNPVNDVLTAIGTLANLFKGKISDAVTKAVVGKSADLVTVPAIPLSYEGVTMTLTPSNLAVSNHQGFLMVTGDVSIQ